MEKRFFFLATKLVAVFVLTTLTACGSVRFQPESNLNQPPEMMLKYVIADDGYRLPIKKYWTQGRPEKIVIALHGFNDYSNSFDAMCRYFSSHNVACFAYDQRGFGETDMKGLWPQPGRLQKDLGLIVELIHHEFPSAKIFVVGESMGGAVILTAANETKADWHEYVNGAILFAPAVWARSTQPWYQRWFLWLAVHTFPGWTPTGEGLKIKATDNIEALRAMGRDDNVIKKTRIDAIFGLTELMDAALISGKDMPFKALVLYGDNDEVIPKEPTCKMLSSMQQSERDVHFRHYPNGYHMLTRDLQAEAVFEDSIQWMSNMFHAPLTRSISQSFCEN